MNLTKIFSESELSLEVVILMIAGLILLITGTLLFPVATGGLPYYENGLYGLLLVMFSLQTISMGKTPFGDLKRSKLVVTAGIIIGGIGTITCFIPDAFNDIPRLLLFLFFGPGGALLLLQMILSKDKLRAWSKYGGIFRHLIAGCTVAYVSAILISILLWNQSLLSVQMTAILVLIYGAAIVYLSFVLRKIYSTYPQEQKRKDGEVELPIDRAMILFTSVFMIILGVLLIPVNLGLLPFSGSAQLGLLMMIFAIQMIASGSTPIGVFPRSLPVILIGFLFAALGTVSCIIPEILVYPLTLLVGVLNILGGAISIGKFLGQKASRTGGVGSKIPSILVKLTASQLILNVLAITFGLSMLISHLLPGLVIGVVLAANGAVLLYLLHVLFVIDRIQRN
jgi:hypothetical protein